MIMAEGKSQKRKGGLRKIGRSKRKGLDLVLSSFVRGKISGEKYMKEKKLSSHHRFIEANFNI